MGRYFRILGIILLLIGIVLLLNSIPTIIGFVIFGNVSKQVGSILGIAFVVGGLMLLMSSKRDKMEKLEKKLVEEESTKGKIKLIEQAYQQRVLNSKELADELNDIVPLKGMTYKTDKQFTVESEDEERYSLSTRNDPKLAYAVRDIIRDNSDIYLRNCELHISKTESTKHHKKGLRK